MDLKARFRDYLDRLQQMASRERKLIREFRACCSWYGEWCLIFRWDDPQIYYNLISYPDGYRLRISFVRIRDDGRAEVIRLEDLLGMDEARLKHWLRMLAESSPRKPRMSRFKPAYKFCLRAVKLAREMLQHQPRSCKPGNKHILHPLQTCNSPTRVSTLSPDPR